MDMPGLDKWNAILLKRSTKGKWKATWHYNMLTESQKYVKIMTRKVMELKSNELWKTRSTIISIQTLYKYFKIKLWIQQNITIHK